MITYKENVNKLKIRVVTVKTENERQNLKTLQDEQRQECIISRLGYTIKDGRCDKITLTFTIFF